jgi:hypothetical protein
LTPRSQHFRIRPPLREAALAAGVLLRLVPSISELEVKVGWRNGIG